MSALAEHDTKKYWDCSRMTFLNLIIIIALDGGETYRLGTRFLMPGSNRIARMTPANIYLFNVNNKELNMFKVKNENTRTTTTPERR